MLNYLRSLWAKLSGKKGTPTVWDIAREKNAAILKEWNKTAAKEIVLDERFVTADGRVYYTHKNIADLGVIREAKLRELTTRAAFGITPQRIANYEAALSKANETKNKDEILRISTNFVADMRTPPELLTLCELGALLVFRDDERPDTFNALIHAEKVKAAQLDDNAQFFFAFTGWALIVQTLTNLEQAGKLEGWMLTNEADFYDYLQQARAKVTAKKVKDTNYLKELHKLQSEIAECDYIVSGGRAEVIQQLQNWSIESYYRALQLQVEKAEAQARALEKPKNKMAEIISTASFDIDTTKATKNVDALVGSIDRLDKELQQLQKEGKDTAAVEAQIAQQTAQLNRALSRTATTTKGAAAQTAAYTKAQKDLANVSSSTAKQVEKTNISVRQSATVFRRGVAGAKALGKGIAQDLGGALNAVKGGIQGFGEQIAGVAASFGGWGLAIAGAVTVLTPFVASLFEATAAQKVAAEQQKAFEAATENAITAIVEETRANNGLFAALRSGETDQRTRVAIVKQLNEEYPDVIGNTDLLTASEGELARIQALVNDKIRQRILLQAKGQLQADIIAKLAVKTLQVQADAQSKANQQLADDLARNSEQQRKGLVQNLEEERKLFVASQKLSGVSEAEALKQFEENRKKRADVLRQSIAEEILAGDAETQALRAELANLDAAFRDLDKALSGFDFGADAQAASAVASDAAKPADKVQKKYKKEQQALEGTLAALTKQQSELNATITERTRLGDIEKQKELGAELQKVNADIEAAQKQLALYRGETVAAKNSIDELEKAAAKIQGLLRIIDPTDKELVESYQLQLAALNKQIADAKKLLEEPIEVNLDVERLRGDIEKIRTGIADLAVERNRALLALQLQENAALKKLGDNEKLKDAVRKDFAKKREQIERTSTANVLRAQIEAAQKELDLIRLSGDASQSAISEQIAKVEALRLELAQLEGKPVTVKVDVDAKGVEQKTKQAILKAADFAEQLGGQIVDFVSNANQQALQAADNAVAKQQQILDDLLANRETANAQQVELERERLDKLNAEREKAKDKEAIIAQAQIAINLALAVARAVAEGGGIASAVTVGLALSAAVFGFLKAKQASEQAFFDGTLYAKRGKGEKAGRDTIKARLNEGEAVIPTATNREYHPAVKAIYNGTVPADALNAFVTDYQTGRVSRRSLGAVRAVSDGTPQVIVVQPDESIGKHVAKEIQKMPQMQLRGEGLYRIVNTKSGKLLKTQKRNGVLNANTDR